MVRSATTPASESIEVSLVLLGSEMKTFLMPQGSTVGDVLDKGGAGRDVAVKVNGELVALDDICEDGDRLMIASKAGSGL